MKKIIKITSAALALAGIAGCDDFLQGPGLTEDPNFPVTATAEQILVGVQGRAFVQFEGQFARTASIWTQQIAGINNQQRDYGAWYEQREQDINTQFNGIYTAGGLIDIRRLQNLAAEQGNPRLQAIGMVWEAFSMGTYTSLFGDLPYREAAVPGVAVPDLDPQEQIYADIQNVLSQAIEMLQGAPTTALPVDLVYNGNPARWIAAAHTLKARYYLHVAPRVGQQAYQNALTHADQGINEAPTSVAQAIHGQAPGDFRSWHGTTSDDANIWAQFNESRPDQIAHQRMIQILSQRNDPRLAAYFAPTADGGFRGADQFAFGGDPQPWSEFSPNRVFREFRQPFITWAENQLIKAEANFQLGNPDVALVNLNAVRQAVGMGPLPVPITLEEIMVEKWIVQFQNIDVFSDWRRTCYPRLIPGGRERDAAERPVPAARVPGRFVYGQTERQQNPNYENLSPAQQPADNWNFAAQGPCPAGNTGGERYPAVMPNQ